MGRVNLLPPPFAVWKKSFPFSSAVATTPFILKILLRPSKIMSGQHGRCDCVFAHRMSQNPDLNSQSGGGGSGSGRGERGGGAMRLTGRWDKTPCEWLRHN